MSKRSVVIGTAGHIDHGKTTLVRALTGVDTDRLPEEKKRGITIELGFAPWALSKDLEASIVDVPGHEAFVRTMVAGAGGLDAVLLVISAEEGVMPQTREHLRVCELLGIQNAVVALTKVDRLEDAEFEELAIEDVREALASGPFAEVPIVPCSAISGRGIEEVAALMARTLKRAPGRGSKGDPILPIDRVFTIKGHGTVVTGTLLSGSIDPDRDTDLSLIPAGDRETRPLRARALQIRGSEARRATAGTRTALNIAALSKAELHRGDVITSGPRVRQRDAFHALVDYLPHASSVWKSGTSVQVCAGTAHAVGHLDPLIAVDEEGQPLAPTDTLRPGHKGIVRLRLDTAIPIWAGQPVILRAFHDTSAAHEGLTAGGGRVIDPEPSSGRKQRERWRRLGQALLAPEETARLHAIVMDAGALGIDLESLVFRGGVTDQVAALDRLTKGKDASVLVLGRGRNPLLVDAALIEPIRRQMTRAVDQFHDAHPLQPGMTRATLEGAVSGRVSPLVVAAALDGALDSGELRVADSSGSLARPGRGAIDPDNLPAPMQQVLEMYERGGTTPPTLKDLEVATAMSHRAVIEVASLLQRADLLIRITPDLSYVPRAHDALVNAAREHLKAHGELDVQALKAMTGLSRKFAVPFLEHLDRLGVTLRRGDQRVPGPEL